MTKRTALGILIVVAAIIIGIFAAPDDDHPAASPNSTASAVFDLGQMAAKTPPQSMTPAPQPAAPTAAADSMTLEDQDTAAAAAQAAVTAMATQLAGETLSARKARLTSYFAPGSPSPATLPVLPDDGIDTHAVQVGEVNWLEPYQDDQGRPCMLISIQASSTGSLDGGRTTWQDNSDQLWRVTLIRTGSGNWMPMNAEPAYSD